MSELDWHNTTSKESDGVGYDFILDVMPGWLSDQAAEHGEALVRVGRPGWEWWVRYIPQKEKDEHLFGVAETKEKAMQDGMDALNKLMAKYKLGTR